jgi:CheY-like chemotaxis protein
VFAKRYDLVLMDGSMPVLDGFEATKRIRAREEAEGFARTPVVALTAHVIGSAADAWQGAGMDGVLYKPFTLARLAACLDGFVRRNDVSKMSDASPDAGSMVASTSLLDTGSLLDTSALAELREMASGSQDIVNKIINLYATQASACLRDLTEAMKDGNIDEFGRVAHALKSMSYNVGARGVARIANEFENAARLEKRIISPSALEKLAIHMMQTTAELERERLVA